MARDLGTPSIRAVASAFTGVPEQSLPADDEIQAVLVAETIRLALGTALKDEQGFARMHVLALRGWVTRKLRALIPELSRPTDDPGLFLDVLRSGKGANMVFLGDVVELANGYYAPAPTRQVPINQDQSVLVSGVPTRYFVEAGIDIALNGIGRRIRNGGTLEVAIPIQPRQSYVGTPQAGKFDEEAFSSLVARGERRPWSPSPGWRCYQGNTGRYDFEWGQRDHIVTAPLGLLSLWQTPGEFAASEYWLRLMGRGEDSMVRLPTRLFKHVCLIIDSWERKTRSATLRNAQGGAILEVGFPPPEAQTRWLNANGAKWAGSEAGKIRWWLPPESIRTAAEVFAELPLQIEGAAES